MNEKREDNRHKPAPTKDELHAKYDVPSEAPGFEGATPQALARALFRLLKSPQ